MPTDHEQEQLAKLISLVRQALERDEQLRQQYQIGEKFRFVRERLQALLEKIEKETVAQEKKKASTQETTIEADELLVYIHLYNAQGIVLRTWQTMITPKAFFDFSVNRPIYQEKSYIEAFIRSKAKKIQHAYLIVAVKKNQILTSAEEGALKDVLGNPLIKIKEGSLSYKKTISFVHNDQSYVLNEAGDLIKKNNEPSVAPHSV